MKKAKVVDLVNKTTGEIIGYFKKTEQTEVWDWVMYARADVPVHIEYIPTYKLLDYTRLCKAEDKIALLYRFI